MMKYLNPDGIAAKLARVATAAMVSLAVFAGVAGSVRPALAQNAWMERAVIVEQLGRKFTEMPVALGLADGGGIIELLTTGDGTTWTILITLPNGMSRIVVSGEHWTPVPPKLKGLTS